MIIKIVRFIYDIKTGNFTENNIKNVLNLSPKLKKTKSDIKDIKDFEGFGA